MIDLPLLKHGQHINPAYKPVPGRTESWAGKSVDKDRPDGQSSGIVKRFKKRIRSSVATFSLGCIKCSYPGAIEYTSSPTDIRGLSILTPMFSLPVVFFLFLPMGFQSIGYGDSFGIGAGIFMITACSIFSIYITLFISRLELFRPEDEPTIFDRKNRRVYRILRETQPGFAGLFKRWPMMAVEYDWDLIDAEHTATVATTGSTLLRNHSLVFIVRRSAEDPTIIDSFNIGNSLMIGEQTVAPVWEHIRCFMEENGPHLPPGESLSKDERPTTLWQSFSASGPFGSNYGKWWRTQTGFTLIIHILFPLFVPFFILLGFFNWLSYKTAIPIRWPKEVRQAIGMSDRSI